MKFKSISNRIFAYILPTITITVVLFAVLSYYMSNTRINNMIDEKMYESLRAAELEIRLELYKNAAVAIDFANHGESMSPDTFAHAEHRQYLLNRINSNENTFGGGVWFEPYAFDPNSYYFGPFLYVDQNGDHYTYKYEDYADYFHEDWYLKGKNSGGRLAWSKVYYDAFSHSAMVTASQPFFGEDGIFLGVGTADMDIGNIRTIISDISVSKTGKALLIGAEGEYVSFLDESKSVSDKIQQDGDASLADFGKQLLENESGHTMFSYNGTKLKVYYMTMADIHWKLAVTIEESEINSSAWNYFMLMTIIPGIGLALVIVGVWAIVRYLRRIIHKVNSFTDLAASGDLSRRILVTETDEFGFMEQRLNAMISRMSEMSGRSAELLKKAENSEHLLFAVTNVASILLQSEIEDFDCNLWKCMGLMAGAVGADRVYIWKNHSKDGQLYCTQLYEWSENADPQQGKNITIDIPYSENMTGWEERLSSGQCINTLVRDMSPEEREQLSLQGILSILVVPVFMRDDFWGFVGFDDCHSERLFSGDEETILRSGSLLIAHSLLKNMMTLDIRAAVEAARAASSAKSNFLSNMSHEIRTPLNAITGMTLIGKSAPDAKKKDYALGKIEDASNHLLGVINDILDMSKIEANRFELSYVEFNFETMMQKVVGVNNFRMNEKKQDFTVFLDNNIPKTIIGDDQRLAQVITNLLSNAAKFTPEQGTIRLDARLLGEENGVYEIQIEVTDTGIGIDADKQAQIFNAFEQAENDTTRKFGGTGLGLSISRRIVELMGGGIRVESEPGKGSKFIFTIKAERGAETARSPLNPGVNRANVRLLLVDDEADIREYFTSITERYGVACDTAAGGEEALRLLDCGAAYDIFFIDWSMPGMNGIELAGKIKSRVTGDCVIIMISAFDWDVIEKEAKSAGVDKFLPKPVFPSSVADCINECLAPNLMSEIADKPRETVSFQGYRMLLAEDVEINREIVLSVLEPTRIEIDCAENGIQAVQKFSGAPERYDMIFMDVQMPEMDGLTATRRIRSLGFAKAREIPIIAMTANVFREDIENCKEAGMNDHVGKPLDFDQILQKMEIWLRPRGT